jgi:hypothetical protein
MTSRNRQVPAAVCVLSVAVFVLSACQHPTQPTAPAVTVSSVAVTGVAPGVGATAQFSATATLSDGTTQVVTTQASWASSNTAVASTNSSGVVSGLAAGEVDITATYQNASGKAHLAITRAATPTYTITGTVTDGTSGGVLPNIDVQATDSAGQTLATKTGSAGTYTIGGLVAGTVTLTASAVGYQALTRSVTLTSDTRVDMVLPRVECKFAVNPTSFSFSSAGGHGTVTIVAQERGCTWTATSNDSFLAITSGASGLDNGTVSFTVAPNPIGFPQDNPILGSSARSGTLTIAGTTVTVRQDVPRLRDAAYDSTLKAPVCQDVGEGCGSDVARSAGPGEMNQPNTIFSSCSDGSSLASIDSILLATPDGTPLTAGRAIRMLIQARPAVSVPRVYVAADALRAAWVEVPVNRVSNTQFVVNTVLPASAGLQAVRATYPGADPGSGPCATGTDFDNDDLVFRVQ